MGRREGAARSMDRHCERSAAIQCFVLAGLLRRSASRNDRVSLRGELAGIELMEELSWSSIVPWIREVRRKAAN